MGPPHDDFSLPAPGLPQEFQLVQHAAGIPETDGVGVYSHEVDVVAPQIISLQEVAGAQVIVDEKKFCAPHPSGWR
jgi:hypothetical protein